MWLFLALAGCGDIKAGDTADDTGDAPNPEGVQVVTLETRDGINLEADFYPAMGEDRPGIVLLHMNPVNWDRTSWPGDFLQDLVDHDFSLMVVDRRGSGNSEGVATEAFEGEKGKWDVEACVLRLQEEGMGQLAILAGSNGTTSQIDYTAWAPGEGLPEPHALGFMTGGNYTENNTEMTEITTPRALFTFSEEEKAWSEMQGAVDPGTWEFLKYDPGAHGTLMFEEAPEVAYDLVSFYADALD
jgi:pimeloyl-ACP methyl ester carboxylesterase